MRVSGRCDSALIAPKSTGMAENPAHLSTGEYMSQSLHDRIAELEAENAALKHDLERYIGIANAEATLATGLLATKAALIQRLEIAEAGVKALRYTAQKENIRLRDLEARTVRVPVDAYLWLMGMGNDCFQEDRDGKFWWRSAFNERAGLDMVDIYEASKKFRTPTPPLPTAETAPSNSDLG